MINQVEEFILKKNADLPANLIFEGLEKYSDKKISIVFSIRNKMASIEVLENGTSDFLIADKTSEEIIFTATCEFTSFEEVAKAINSFLEQLILA